MARVTVRVLVTRDGRPVAVIAPMGEANGQEVALARLVVAGLLSRLPAPPEPPPPAAAPGPGTPLSAMVLEDRR
jgi:antitoxin (DNA-binding transcriptional repressor) of toxin-antitoxin stability system